MHPLLPKTQRARGERGSGRLGANKLVAQTAQHNTSSAGASASPARAAPLAGPTKRPASRKGQRAQMTVPLHKNETSLAHAILTLCAAVAAPDAATAAPDEQTSEQSRPHFPDHTVQCSCRQYAAAYGPRIKCITYRNSSRSRNTE